MENDVNVNKTIKDLEFCLKWMEYNVRVARTKIFKLQTVYYTERHTIIQNMRVLKIKSMQLSKFGGHAQSPIFFIFYNFTRFG